MKKKYFAVGDVHGCFEELEALIERLPLDSNSVLVFLGDYVDRGPESKSVIDFIIELKKKHRVVALKGNHEAMFLDFIHHPESSGAALFVLNGGSSTLASYSQKEGHFEIPASHIEFLEQCLPYYETEDFFFVHAGVRNRPLREVHLEKEDTLLWIRDAFLKSEYDWGKVIVHGHSPMNEVTIMPNKINVDTGCVFGGRLSAIELPAKKVYQEPKDRPIVPLFLKDARPQRIAHRFQGAVGVFVLKNNQVYGFETLNYNDFGLLMRETAPSVEPLLSVGESISGVIGQDPIKQVAFTGEVVRVDLHGAHPMYGVKIKVDNMIVEKRKA